MGWFNKTKSTINASTVPVARTIFVDETNVHELEGYTYVGSSDNGSPIFVKTPFKGSTAEKSANLAVAIIAKLLGG